MDTLVKTDPSGNHFGSLESEIVSGCLCPDFLSLTISTIFSGLLDVTVSTVVSRSVFTPDVLLACDVSLPKTPHYVREELSTFQHSSKLRHQPFLLSRF